MTGEEPQYSRLAARLLAGYIDKEVRGQGIASFSQSVSLGHAEGLIGDADRDVRQGQRPQARRRRRRTARTWEFEYFGIKTVYDRYLLRHPSTRLVIETPQYFLLRVACGLSRTPAEAIGFYRLMSSLAYLPSSPTLFNSGTSHPQMSSCFLVDSPRDDLDSIYDRYAQVARLSKFSGGIGIAWSRVRSRGALIRGTNGPSNGIVPLLRTLDASVAAVNQGGRRKGAACVYLEPWHPDIEEFLELRDNTGEDARRTHNLNLANWIPDEFMRRVEADEMWSLIDPDDVPELPDLWGEEFDAAYRAAEADGRYVRQVKARDLYGKMMRTLAQTGNGWMTFKDACNAKCNQTGAGGRRGAPVEPVHRDHRGDHRRRDRRLQPRLDQPGPAPDRRAGRRPPAVDWAKLRDTVRTAVPFLDRVIDLTFYPSEQAAASNPRWRPVGLGVMGLQDVFFALRLPFDSRRGARAVRPDRRGDLPDRAGGLGRPRRTSTARTRRSARPGPRPGSCSPTCGACRARRPSAGRRCASGSAETGLRNSLLIAIAPTATIASIAGCYECIEPQVSNLFKRETMSGEFLQVNTALVAELKAHGLWTRAGPGADQAGRGLGAGHRRAARGDPRAVPHRLGTAAAGADRPGRRPGPVHRPEPVAQPVPGRADHRQALVDVPARLEVRPEDHLLPAVAPGDPDRPGDRRGEKRPAAGARTCATGADSARHSDAVACSLENPETCEACQ